MSLIIIGNILFGIHDVDLSSLSNTAFFAFEFVFIVLIKCQLCGRFKFEKLNALDPSLGYLYGIIFITTMDFLMIPYFYGIIINTYTELRMRMQLTT